MKGKLTFLWNRFCMLSTCILAFIALFTALTKPEEPQSPQLLWQILVMAFLCTLCSLIYPWGRTVKRAELAVRIGVHYILINLIVLGLGSAFGWCRLSHPKSVITILASTTVVFILVSAASWSRSAVSAKKMNKRLKHYQNNPPQNPPA